MLKDFCLKDIRESAGREDVPFFLIIKIELPCHIQMEISSFKLKRHIRDGDRMFRIYPCTVWAWIRFLKDSI
jgi:hypothetical protein